MRIIVETPEQLVSQRVALADELINLLKQQQRSCLRYAARMQTIRNKLVNIDRKIGQ